MEFTKRYSFKGGAKAIFGSRPATAMQVALAATRYSSVRASSRIYMMTAVFLSRRCNLMCRVSRHLRVCVCICKKWCMAPKRNFLHKHRAKSARALDTRAKKICHYGASKARKKNDFTAPAASLRPQRYIMDLITCLYTVNDSTRASETRAKKIGALEGF